VLQSARTMSGPPPPSGRDLGFPEAFGSPLGAPDLALDPRIGPEAQTSGSVSDLDSATSTEARLCDASPP